ncbi:hypothetical protein [Sanguibacter massiliensis]|uniref:hypothetical protein n=1 Tax=Sanguibacter massiliensis TaxID=1973217 RepID=UPI000C863859|nr:hypothetical protein [Sanguibacter massiliensis]
MRVVGRATRERLSDRLLVVRPGLIVGPGDGSDRFGYWPARFTRGGTVLVRETAQRAVQVVDVRDLAAFVVRAAARRVVGVVDAVGDPWSSGDVLGLDRERRSGLLAALGGALVRGLVAGEVSRD